MTSAAKRADEEFGAVYACLMTALEERQKVQLQTVQCVWLNYRAQACRGERNPYSGGTASLTAYPACIEALTRPWISDLKEAYWWRVEKFGG